MAGGETIGGKFYAGGQFIKRLETAAFKSFAHAAAAIRKDARGSIRRLATPAPPGKPIHTRTGKGGGLAKRAILYKASKTGAVIGFSASIIDEGMEVHEHGGTRGGVQFPPRPVMFPALMRNLARFHREWRGAI